MRSIFGREALFSISALILSAIVVQSLYATVIRPRAEAILAMPAPPAPSAQASTPSGATSPALVPEGPTRNLRSVFVILKDY
ncbi:MAG TPA: hypothetical protein VLX90_08285, partial [Steroidobacteraceae bacterium]|nr:hypothetical protein [Steroidobacteraceae bacterium]